MHTFLKTLCLAAGIAPSILFAQNPASELAKYRSLFPNQNEVIIQRKSDLELKVTDSGTLNIVETRIEEKIITHKTMGNSTTTRIYYSGTFNEVSIAEAYTLTPDGTSYKKVKVQYYEHQKEQSDDYFDDDSKFIDVNFSDIKEGAKTYVKYIYKFKDPHFLSGFMFRFWSPIVHSEYNIKCQNGIELNLVEKNFQDAGIIIAKSEKKGFKYYTYTGNGQKAIKEETQMPNSKYFIPHVVPIIKSYTHQGKVTNLLGSVDNLHNWYSSLLRKKEDNYSPELKKLVDSLCTPEMSEEAKVKAIYYWVHENIKYIAFEAGMEGFVPRLAKDVCHKRFGDCKDMSNIMQTMMDMAKVKSGHHVWVGTKDIPYTYEEMPSSNADNHMIAAYIFGDSIIYLDGTANYTTYGYPSMAVQGKEALIHIDDKHYKVAKIPVMPAFKSLRSDSAEFSLDGGKLKGKGNFASTGYYAYTMRNYMSYMKKEKYKEYIEENLNKGSNRCIIDTFQVQNDKNAELPLTINYDFHLDNYVKSYGDELYINMSLLKPMQGDDIKKDRENMLEYEFKSLNKYVFIFNIPDGYAVDYMPAAFEMSDKNITAKLKYSQEGNKLILHQWIQTDFLLLPKEEFESFNKIVNALSRQFNETVVLKKIKK